MKALLAVLLMLLAGPALAGDAGQALQLIGTAVGFINPWVGLAITIAGGLYSQSEARRKAAAQADAQRAAYNASLQDRNVTVLRNDAPWQIIYGSPAPVGGAMVAMFTSGNLDEFKHIVIAYAAHECVAIDEVYIEGDPVGALDANGWVTGGKFFETSRATATENVTFVAGQATLSHIPTSFIGAIDISIPDTAYSVSGNGTTTITSPDAGNASVVVSYFYDAGAPRVNVQKHLSPGGVDTADAFLMGRVPAQWTAAHKLSGYTYIVITLDLNMSRFQGGPPNITAKIRGKKVYDYRTATTGYSTNAALCTADFLRADYGFAAGAAQIDTAAVIAAANACDAQGFNCHGAISTDASRDSNLLALEESMGGRTHWSGGVWRMMAGAWTTPVMDLTDADLAAPIEVLQTANTKSGRYNSVRGSYAPAAQLGVVTDYSPYVVPSYVTADGYNQWLNVSWPFTATNAECQKLAAIKVEQSRAGLTLNYPAHLRAWKLQPGDRVTVTNAELGFAAKTFRVQDWTHVNNAPVGLVLTEDVASMYTGTFSATDPLAPTSTLADPWAKPAAPTGLAAASGTNQLLRNKDGSILVRVLATWTATAIRAVLQGGYCQVQWIKANDASGQWINVDLAPDASSCYLESVPDGIYIIIRVRYITGVGARGDWSAITHFVVGKTAPPAAVSPVTVNVLGAQLDVSWPDNTDADLAYYEVRTSDAGWGNSAGYLYRGRNRNCQLAAPAPQSSLLAYVKAADTSGNYSVAATQIPFTAAALPNPIILGGSFAGSSTTGATYTLNWSDAAPQFGLAGYEVSYGANVKTVKASTITVPADWLGSQLFTVKTVDANGNKSAGASYAVSKIAPNSPANFSSYAIDSTGVFSWVAPAQTTLPISHYLLKKGATYAAATLVGRVDKTFDSFSESQAGTNIYWLVAVDTDGRESPPVSNQLTVFTPPDYILAANWVSDFSGTKSNAIVEAGALVLPVNTTETFAQHFTNNAWATPQDQINAGFPLFIQPGMTTGYYEEVKDYGTVLASMSVNVSVQLETLAGTVSYAVVITVALDAAFTTNVKTFNGTAAFASNFRYVKVRVTVTATDNHGIGRIPVGGLVFRLDAKLRTEQGTATMTLGGAYAQGNITAETLGLWVPGMAMPPAGFTLNGVAAENRIVSALGPSGVNEPLWACVDIDVASDADGGWDGAYAAADLATTGHLMACFMKRSGTAGTAYFGTNPDGSILDLAGTVNNNPYFWNGNLPALNTWYLLVGYVHAIGYGTTDTGLAGIYDLAGTRVVAGTEFKANTGATQLMHRAYHFYNTTASGLEVQWMTRPVVIPCPEAAAPGKISYLLKCAKEYGAAVRMPSDVVDVINPVAQAIGLNVGAAQVDFVDKPNPHHMNVFILNGANLVAGDASYGYRRY